MDADRKNKFPPHIREKLEQRGYFSLSKEQRVKAHKECLESLKQVNIPDFKTVEKVLSDLRGGSP